MEPITVLLIMLGLLFLFLFLGVPIAFALLLPSALIIYSGGIIAYSQIVTTLLDRVGSFTLLAIPMFIFAAEMVNRIGCTDDIVEVANILVGRIAGGLALVNVVASMLFAGVSGSSAADTAGVGGVLIPAMKKQGYSSEFSAAITSASSTIGNIIPPSIMMIVYGATAGVSIGALFIAGIIPGILVGFSQMLTCYLWAKKKGWGVARKEKFSFQDIITVIKKGFFPGSIFLIIIGGITGGVFTATEAAAVASVYAIIIGPVFYKQARSISVFIEGAKNAAIISAITYYAIVCSTIFAWILSYYRVITPLADWLDSADLTLIPFLILLSFIYLLFGMLMDPIVIIVVMTPIIVPMANIIGIHPLHLGIVSIMAIRIGTVTPPYGISGLIAAKIADISFPDMIKEISVFVAVFLVVVLLIIIFPSLVLFLPETFFF